MQTLLQHGTIHGSGIKVKKGRRGRMKKGEGEGAVRHCIPAKRT
jgi:hypothetical protein